MSCYDIRCRYLYCILIFIILKGQNRKGLINYKYVKRSKSEQNALLIYTSPAYDTSLLKKQQ